MKSDNLLCVVTGMEQSGTTFLSKLLASHPDIMCGFEGGLLLRDLSSFTESDPWYGWMQESTEIGHWGILPENMEKICRADSYAEACRLVKRHAGEVGSPRVRRCFQQAKWILDKTPRYLDVLESVMGRVDAPFVVIRKNIFNQYRSFKKRNLSMEFFLLRYICCKRQLAAAKQKYADRLFTVSYEELVKDRQGVLLGLYRFLGAPAYAEASLEAFRRKTRLVEHGGLHRRSAESHAPVDLTPSEVRKLERIRQMSIPRLRVAALAARLKMASSVLSSKLRA